MPAMPITVERGEVWSEFDDHANRLTKREMMAMHMMAACRRRNTYYRRMWDDMAKDAIEITDTLLAELERTK